MRDALGLLCRIAAAGAYRWLLYYARQQGELGNAEAVLIYMQFAGRRVPGIRCLKCQRDRGGVLLYMRHGTGLGNCDDVTAADWHGTTAAEQPCAVPTRASVESRRQSGAGRPSDRRSLHVVPRAPWRVAFIAVVTDAVPPLYCLRLVTVTNDSVLAIWFVVRLNHKDSRYTFDDPNIPFGAVTECLQRCLVPRGVVRGKCLCKSVKLDHHNALVYADFVGLSGIAANNEASSRPLNSWHRKLRVGCESIRILDRTIRDDPVRLGHRYLPIYIAMPSVFDLFLPGQSPARNLFFDRKNVAV